MADKTDEFRDLQAKADQDRITFLRTEPATRFTLVEYAEPIPRGYWGLLGS